MEQALGILQALGIVQTMAWLQALSTYMHGEGEAPLPSAPTHNPHNQYPLDPDSSTPYANQQQFRSTGEPAGAKPRLPQHPQGSWEGTLRPNPPTAKPSPSGPRSPSDFFAEVRIQGVASRGVE